MSVQRLADWYLGNANSLHNGPHNGQATGFRRKRINLISTLSDIAKEAFNGIGRADIPMHDRREGIKRQEMLLIFHQAQHGLRITHAIFALEGR